MLQTFAIYILKPMLCSALLLAYYWVALRNKRFHYYNRFYLLLAVIVSIVLPLLNLQLLSFKSNNDAAIRLYQIIYVGEIQNETIKRHSLLNWQEVLMVVLFVATVYMLVALVIKIIKLYKFKRIYPVTKTEEFDFINTDLQQAPFSFLKNIFWRNDISLDEPTGKQILQHEITHIKQNAYVG